MIILYKNLLNQWISSVQEKDLETILKNAQLWKSEEECHRLYKYLKQDWEKIYEGDKETFEKIKKEISSDTYEKLLHLYQEAKKKYKF